MDGLNPAVPGVRKQRQKGVVVERFDEMVVEARLLRSSPVLFTAVAGDRNDDGVLAARLPAQPGRHLKR